MDAQTTEQNAGKSTSGNVALNDVLYVALAIAAILFGNVFLCRVLDVALDAWAR